MTILCPTSLHADEAAPRVKGHTVDEPRRKEGNDQEERGVGWSDLLLEVVHQGGGLASVCGSRVLIVLVVAFLAIADARGL